MKKIMKRVFAFMLIICLLAIPVFSNIGSIDFGTVEAADATSEEFEAITFNDCGIADGTHQSMIAGMASMDKIEMKGKVTFQTNSAWGRSYVYIGTHTVETDSGIHMLYDGSGSVVFQLLPSNTTLVSATIQPGAETEFAVAFEYMENGKDVYTTIKVNSTQIYDGVIADGASLIGRGFRVGANDSFKVTIASVETPCDNEEFQSITFSDCGLKDGTYNTNQSGMAVDKVEMKGYLSFPSNGGWAAPGVAFGTAGTSPKDPQKGIHIFRAENGKITAQDTGNDNVTLFEASATDLGLEAVHNNFIKVAVAFEYVGNGTDARVTISLDGKVYYNDVRPGLVGKIGPGFTSYGVSADKPLGVKSVKKEFTTVTLSDCGIADGTYNGVNKSGASSGIDSMDMVELKAYATFPSDGVWDAPRITFGGTGTANAFLIFWADGKIKVFDSITNTYPCMINSIPSGENLYGRPIELAMAFEHVTRTDLKVTFSIDGYVCHTWTIANRVGVYQPAFNIVAWQKAFTVASVRKEFNTVTLSDCGIADGTYNGVNKAGVASGFESMDKVELKMKATFPSDGGWDAPRITFGSQGTSNAFLVFYDKGRQSIRLYDSHSSVNNYVCEVSNVRAGANLYDRLVEFAMTFEHASDTDLKVTFSIDGKTYYSKTLSNRVGVYQPAFHIVAWQKATTVASVEKTYELVTFEDCGIEDGTCNGTFKQGLDSSILRMDQVELKGHMAFPFNGEWNSPSVYVGSQNPSGFHVFYAGSTLQVQDCLNGDDPFAAVEAAHSTPLEVSFKFEHINGTDVKVTFSVDGVVCNEKTYADYLTKFTPGFYVNGQEKPMRVASVSDNYVAEDGDVTDFRKLTLGDFGLKAGAYQNQTMSTQTRPGSLMNTILEMDLQWTGEENEALNDVVYNPWICYGGLASGTNAYWGGIQFRFSETEIRVAGSDNLAEAFAEFCIPASAIGKDSFYNNRFKLGISFGKINADNDGKADDVAMGIYINGALYEDSYITIKNGVDFLGNTLAVFPDPNHTTGKSILNINNAAQTATSFDTLSLDNFGVTPNVYKSNNNANSEGSEGTYEGSVAGKIFKSNIKFGYYDSKLIYGGLTIGTERTLEFNPAFKKFMLSFNGTSQQLYARDAGVQLANRIFELGISGRNVDSDGDGMFDDYEVGIWFDGNLYQNQYFYVQDSKDLLTSNIAVYCADRPETESANRGPIDGDGYVALGDVVQTEAVESTYCLDTSAYIVAGDSISINGSTYTGTKSILTPDVYDITYTERNSTYKDKVTAYKTYDATEDGEVDVRDLVALLKYEDGQRTLEAPGQLALNIENNILPETAYADMVDKLLASDDVIGAKDISDGIIGKMGPDAALTGSYITDVQETKEGTQVISISDTAGSNWTSDTKALDGSGLDYILNFEADDRGLRVLQITDTQMIGSVTRSDFAWAGRTELTDEARRELLYDELDTLIEETKPDLILVTGDNTYGVLDYDANELKALANYLDSFRIPWAPINGNHDQEIAAGIDGICEIYENAKYCLFTRRDGIGGAGNYAIGLAKNGQLDRVFYMMDANGCWNTTDADKADYADGTYIGAQEFILFPGQLDWYRTVGAKVEAFAGKEVPSSLGIHIPPAEAGKTGKTGGDAIDYISGYLKEVGTDSVFFGHIHAEGWTAEYDGITYTCGMLTGGHVSGAGNNGKTGGTLITVNGGTIEIDHKHITTRNIETGMPQ